MLLDEEGLLFGDICGFEFGVRNIGFFCFFFDTFLSDDEVVFFIKVFNLYKVEYLLICDVDFVIFISFFLFSNWSICEIRSYIVFFLFVFFKLFKKVNMIW